MSQPPPASPVSAQGLTPSPLRSLLAIAVGFLLRRSLVSIGAALIASIVSSAQAPRAMVMEVIWGGIAAVFSGLAAGIIAGRYEVRHGMVLSAIYLGMGAFVAGQAPGHVGWHLGNAALAALAVAVGAALATAARRRRVERLRIMSQNT